MRRMTSLTGFRVNAGLVSVVIGRFVLWQFGWRALRRSAARTCVADLKRNFYSFQNIAKQNQRASSSCDLMSAGCRGEPVGVSPRIVDDRSTGTSIQN
jgi:hypothetical protein